MMRPPDLQIRLFGGLDLRYDGRQLPPPESGRAVSLLAYLLLHREVPQQRQHLAFLLWPDSSEAQARTNLRHLLHILRRALPEPDRYLDVTAQSLQWRADAPFWLDVAAFEDALSGADGADESRDLVSLRSAAGLYSGDLLEGWYDEWLIEDRERLRQRYLNLLEQLATTLAKCGEHAPATEYAETLLRQEPLREESYRLLMQLYDGRGERARALRVYHACVTTLERELAVAPSAQTQAAYEALLPLEREFSATRQAERAGAPLVGRARERRRLATLWRASTEGSAQLVLLTGEPGVGKTRLVDELREWCAHQGVAVAVARSYAAEGALAYAPVVAWLRSEVLARHRHLLNQPHLAGIARLLPEVSTATPNLTAPEPLPENDQRQRLFDALAAAILAPDEPLLLIADDLHWADRETLQFLHYLLRLRSDARLLILATARREELDALHPLSDLILGLQALERFTEIEVNRLSEPETAILAEQLAGGPLTGADADRLYLETEGNPLFIVEALRAGWSEGNQTQVQLSPRIQAVIQARLAQLSEPARRLVGFAATIGREFTVDVLAAASEQDDEPFIGGLDELWRRRIVREQGADGYDFTHDKLREVAYDGLSLVRRRQHHLAVARAVERLNQHDPASVSGQLAAHYDRAGADSQAIDWHERAAEAAQTLHAHAEAVRSLRRGIDILRALPDTPERQTRELAFLTALPGPLVALDGYQSAYVSEVQQQAVALARKLGVEPAPPLVWSLAVASMSRGDVASARRYGQQLRARGERDRDDVLVVQSNYVLGISAFWNAEFDAAQSCFESAIQRFRPEDRRAHLLRYGQDPVIICQMRLAFTLWFLGRPGEARLARDEAAARSIADAHWFSRLAILHFAGLLSIETGEYARVREYVSILASLREEHEAAYIQHNGDALIGYVDVLDGRIDTGMAQIEQTLANLREDTQLPGQRSSVVRVLLAARAQIGDARGGLAAADHLLAVNDGVHIWDAEARRMRAEFLAMLGAGSDEVEAELQLALQVAHSQQARSLELRVATSLLRHRLARGAGDAVSEARALLASLVAAVSDGSDTHDLREASGLLTRA